MRFKLISLIFIGLGMGLIANQAMAEMTGSNYKIRWDSVNAGGGEDLSGTTYNMFSTMSEVGSGASSGSSYLLNTGYQQDWTIEDPMFTMEMLAQNDATKRSYSAFDNGGISVTVADTTNLLADDYIVVVENEGASQMVAVGKITGVAAGVISVDRWSGDQTSMNATPAGGNDFLFKLEGDEIDLDTLTTNIVQTGTVLVEADTNATNGYDCTVTEDEALRSVNGDDISDVSDGAVTVGSEEYGVEITGDNAANTGSDNAIPTDPTTLNVMSVLTTSSNSRAAVIYKAAISPITPSGNYSQTTTYICTGRF